MSPIRPLLTIALLCALALPLRAAAASQEDSAAPPARKGKKTEQPVNFVPTAANPLMGDWQGEGPCVAQVLPLGGGKYRALLLTGFDTEAAPLAVLEGEATERTVTFGGDGWSGVIRDGQFSGTKAGKDFMLKQVTRTPPTLGAAPPKGAVVLFDGKNLDAWAKKNGKSWLEEDGPARWKLVEGGAVEVVPGSDCIITHQKFGDCKLHVEFRTLGHPSNSGVFLQDRYEVNINETYARPEQSPNAGFDNCTDDAKPRIRPCRPPLEWQTYDIDFHAPKFDADGKKTANARATVLFNGVKIYDNQELNRPKGAASRLGEAPTGPLMLQEHGMPLQFRNIWLVETSK
jgi:3-keto-disaccharide hydrolase